MVKFAKHQGFDVRSDPTQMLIPWEAEALFNSYLARLLDSGNAHGIGNRKAPSRARQTVMTADQAAASPRKSRRSVGR